MKLSSILWTVYIVLITSVLSQHLELFRQTRLLSSSLFRKNEYETKIFCISDNSSDAVVLNEPFDRNTVRDKKYEEIFDFESYSNKSGNECEIEMDYSKCLSKWKNDSNWKILSSLEVPMGPVYDKRWERFQDYEKKKVIHSDTDFSFVTSEKNNVNFVFNSSENQNALVVSIRGSSNAQFLLCKSQNFRSDFCYWLIIGGWNNTITGIRKCQNGIPLEKPASGSNCSILRASKAKHFALDALEWRTFIITWNTETKTVNLYDSEELVLSYSDSANTLFNITRILYGNPDPLTPTLFRFHKYKYILSKKPDAILISPSLTINYANGFCIDILIGLCPNCELMVKLVDGNSSKKISKTFSSLPDVDGQTLKHGLPTWQYARFDVEDIKEYELPLFVQISTMVAGTEETGPYHWAIGNIRECPSEKSVRQLLLVNKINDELDEPNIVCQKFSYNRSEAVVVKSRAMASKPPSNAHSCKDSRIGVHCKIPCSQYFGENCPRVSKCDQFGCYCSQGRYGPRCDHECSSGNYGYECQKSCEYCIGYDSSQYYNKICNPYDGKCYKGCRELSMFFVPPYCNVGISPLIPTIDYVNETAARVSLSGVEQHEDIGLMIIFEIDPALGKEKGESILATEELMNDTMKKKYFATFTNLVSGQQYFVKTLYNIEHDNQHNLLESWKESFTTACNWDKKFEIEPNTTSLNLIRIHEEKDYVCPDEWYEVEVTMKTHNNDSVSIPLFHIPKKFPMLISNLNPYTHYNVCVSNFDVGFDNCQTVLTLEIEPSIIQNLRVREINVHDALIEWSPPLQPNGILEGYQLMISVVYYDGCQTQNLKTPENLLMSHIYLDISTGDSMSFRIQNLTSFVTYEVKVRAYNSKFGIEDNIIITTEELEIPTEIFDDLKLENDTILWKYPKDCSKVTGRIDGARLFLTGLSEHVQNYSTKEDVRGYSFMLSNRYTTGAEKYQVRIHVVHRLYGIQNETAYNELVFVTNPRPPPQVEDLEIIEVDQKKKTLTLRWREPKPPQNGEISYYSIKISLGYADTTHIVLVYPNETCQLWSDLICKTIDQPFGERQYIQVTGYNKGVERPGETTQIDYRRHETAPDAPKIISEQEIDNGVIELRWKHPSKTGGPLKKFLIIVKTLLTLLENQLILLNSTKVIEYPIFKYQLEYSTHLYLLPSTRYNISIKAATNLKQSKATNVTIFTKFTLAFEFEPRVKKNDDGLTFDVFIPPIVNNTFASSVSISVKGAPACENPAKPLFMFKKGLVLGYNETVWVAAAFSAFLSVNRSFTIGDNKTYNKFTNCLLRPDSKYVVLLTIYSPSFFTSQKSSMVVWESQPIYTDKIYTPHAYWSVPLIILIIIGGAGGIFYYVRIRQKKESIALQMNSVDTPIDNNSHVLTPVDTTDNTDLISVNSVFP
ncbi:uncharacterized protein LOC123259122 isoform X2 [Cotesia glomerata]|uniref:uncharacterized protein LOC123259122 isoform X2 n=1 Tax=Cotesia glomerata TaxID=32391 RepID=UPI001D01EC7F|nr:uncharacterized protein LOC123259122 isoform X2 [Cotesia glomerata]